MRPFVLTALATLLTFAAVPDDACADDAPPTDGQVVFEEHFDDLRVGPGQTWGWQSTAYSRCTENPDNPNAWKLDRLTEGSLTTDPGYLTITATAASDGRWNTGLLTTGDSCGSGGDGTEVRTGDLLLAHVRLPSTELGSWPGLWTWRDGKNEMDVFEWHPDAPDTLEFVNHVKAGNDAHYVRNPDLIGADRWVFIAARFGADDTTWYLGTDPDQLHAVADDHLGVGPDFAAYPVLNLSVGDGHWHPAPAGKQPLTFAADLLAVLRPDAGPDHRSSGGGVRLSSITSTRTRLPQTTIR